MPSYILCIGDLAFGFLPQQLEETGTQDLEIATAGSFEDAEEYLFTVKLSLIIADVSIPGLLDQIQMVKEDEMFQSLPIVAVLPEKDVPVITDIFSRGLDAYILRQDCEELLVHQILPLVKNNLSNYEMTEKMGTLHEQAIRDFILLDLIKSYIPKTIWDIAEDFAHQQKILIPEEEMELTIAFGDIQGFTTMTEHMDPKAVIRTLNEVFHIATKVIYSNNGDVDKFIGDAFLSVFESPRDAVRSMVQMQKEMTLLNDQRKQNNLPCVHFRIGVHTGPIIRGNVGGNKRYDNTLIGDTVNTASRLESISEPGGVMISDSTRAGADLNIPEEFKTTVRLRGKVEELSVYSIFDFLSRRMNDLD